MEVWISALQFFRGLGASITDIATSGIAQEFCQALDTELAQGEEWIFKLMCLQSRVLKMHPFS